MRAATTGATTASAFFSSAIGALNLPIGVRAPANTINRCNSAGGKTRHAAHRPHGRSGSNLGELSVSTSRRHTPMCAFDPKRTSPVASFLTSPLEPSGRSLQLGIQNVFVWALAYLIFDVAPAGANLVYFAFVNYATLGYGDVLPVEGWRLLSPLTAMNGMLLFWMVDRSHFRGPTANLGAHPRYQRLTEVSSLTPGNIGALCRGL